MRVDQCYSIADFRTLARKRLPRPVFDFLDGGAEDEVTLRHNRDDFDTVQLVPRVLTGVSDVDMSSTLLGQKVSVPLMLSPTGMNRMFHNHGERAVSRAAERFGLFYSLSTLSTVSIEEIARLNSGPNCFQIYIHKDRGLSRHFINRCKDAGYAALSLTVDTTIGGNRERDLRNGMTIPPRFSWSDLLSFATHARWSLEHFVHGDITLANLVDMAGKDGKLQSIYAYVGEQLDAAVTWNDAKEMIQQWGGPFAIKGLVSVEDAKRAVDIGASAIILSNHGGRQLDGGCSAFYQLPAIVDAVGGKIEIIVEGGVRRGTHIAKAISLGATAVAMGRGYLYALAAGGQAGVERALERLIAEYRRDLMLLGCASTQDLGPHLVRSAPQR